MEKARNVLIVIALIVGVVALSALGVHQIIQVAEKIGDAKLSSLEAECALYLWPHAIITDAGDVMCYTIYEGSERMIPLDVLRETYGELAE